MSNQTQSPVHRSTLSILSVGAIAALALAACAPDEELTSEQDDTQVEEAPAPEAEEESEPDAEADADADADAEDDAADDQAEDTTTDEAGSDEDGAEDPEASGEHPVYQAIEAVLAEYSDGVITEFEDNTNDGGYIEVFVYDGTTEWELEVDSETFEIIDTEDDGIDSDDEAEAQAVQVDIIEALQAAEAESGAEPQDGELDTEDGTVVWQFEMTNDVEVYVDVATAEVVATDDD